MALNASETLAKSAGDVYIGPLGTGAPTDAQIGVGDAAIAVLEGLGWQHLGWVHEDGPELANFEGETTKHPGWNRIAPIRTVTRRAEPEVTVPCLQWNVENLQQYFLGATYDAPSRTLTIPEEGSPAEVEMLIVVTDAARELALWLGKVSGRPGGSLSFPEGGDDLSQVPITFDVLSADPFMKVVGIDPAEEES